MPPICPVSDLPAARWRRAATLAAGLSLALLSGLAVAAGCAQQRVELHQGGQTGTILLPPCAKTTVNASRLETREGTLHAQGQVVIQVSGPWPLPLTILADAATVHTRPADPALGDDLKRLARIAAHARTARTRLGLGAAPDATARPAMVRQGAAEEPELARLLKRHDWPGFREVGVDGAEIFMAAMQNARLPFIAAHIERARAAVRAGNAWPGDLAILEDRLLSEAGKPQRYGTALQRGQDGLFRPLPIEAPGQVDARRREAGLESLQHYLSSVNR